MEKTTTHLMRKISIPLVAVILVVGIVIYTGGFENFLKLLGIKASQLETIELSSESQLLGEGDSSAILEGVSVTTTFDSIPADSGDAGFVMSTFSSEDPETNTHTNHVYTSPAIDLGSESPTLNTIRISYHQSESGSLIHSYRSGATISDLESAPFQTMEVGGSGGTGIANLGVTTDQFVQVRVVFAGDTYVNRSAVYGWTMEYNPNLVMIVPEPILDEEQPQLDEQPDTNTPPADETPDDAGDVEEEPVEEEIVEEEEDDRIILTLDFTATENLPDQVDISLLTSTIVGVKTVVSLENQSTEQITPLFNFPDLVEPDYYSLVLEADGYKTVVVPFRALRFSARTLEVPSFQKLTGATDFDLNGDGSINSLDVTLLISKFGM